MKKVIFLLLICILVLPMGCTDDLAGIDLSGEYELLQYENDWAYSLVSRKEHSLETSNPRERFGAICAGLETREEILLLGKRYQFETTFSNRDGNPRVDIWESVTGNQVRLNYIDGNFDGDEWGNSVDRAFYTPKETRKLTRSIEKTQFFIDDTYGEKFIVKITTKANVAEKYDSKNKQRLMQRRWEIKGSSEIAIGNTLALKTSSLFEDAKIGLYLLDCDLNGELNERDKIFCDYTGKFLSFNKPIRLTSSFKESKDNYYQLSLAKSAIDNNSLKLIVKLVREGEEAQENKNK